MKYCSVLLALALLASPAFAQIGWFEQNRDGEDLLFSIDLLDASTITAVGEAGLIIHSDDGGATWKEVPSGTTRVLRRIRWHSPALGVVLGNSGTALKSTDGGHTWSALNTGTTSALYDVHFYDERHWMVIGQGARVLTTTDAGATFTDEGGGLNNYNEIALQGDFGLIVGNVGTARRTTDGGKKWGNSKTNVGLELTSVSIGNDSTAVAVGINGTIIRTTNTGESWNQVYASFPISQYRLTAVRHLTEQHVVLAGYGGLILESYDGGITWTAQESNTQLNIEGMEFTDSRIGNTAGWNRCIMRTHTGGTLAVTRMDEPRPAEILLGAAWPNPLSRSAHAAGRVRLQIPASGNMSLTVHDLLGRERLRLLDRSLESGIYTVDWDPGTLSRGVYLLRLTAGNTVRTRKFTVID